MKPTHTHETNISKHPQEYVKLIHIWHILINDTAAAPSVQRAAISGQQSLQ